MQGSARIDELRQKFHENPRRYFAPLANEYRKAGDPEQAIAICRAHLAQQPGHMSGHVVYGQALYDAGRIDESRTVFEKALSLDPDNAIVLRQLGDIARQRGETAEAKHWYGRALDADPHNTEVAAYIAELTEPLTETAEAAPSAGMAATESAAEAAPSVEVEATEPGHPEPVEVVEATAAPPDMAAAIESEIQTEEGRAAPVEASSDAPASVEVFEESITAEPAEPADVASAEAEEPGERARSDMPVTTPIVPLADVAWRKTPPHEDSPFVTRTMAELYAKQGYRAAALDVYRQLALVNPDDQEIVARIGELSVELGADQDTEPQPESSDESEQDLAVSVPEPMTARDESAAVSVTEQAQPEGARAAVPDIEALEWPDLSEEEAYTPAVEEVEPEEPVAAADDRHFTELELPRGDAWDTDVWGAGFSADESTDLELDVPDTPMVNLSVPEVQAPEAEAPAAQGDASAEEEAADASMAPAASEQFSSDEAPVASEPAAALAESPPVEDLSSTAESIAPDDFVEAERFVAAEEEALTAAEAPEPKVEDESHLVAYSPKPPQDQDLAHYEPRGPTVREFFATLGARRPPSPESAQSFTARAVVPSMETPSDYPLAASAFADLFPNSPIAEEDTRAAFALSGALSGTPSGAPAPSASETKRNTPSTPAPPTDNNQESEEDIRKFREWLDGLAES